jgi:bacteriorhodopsin
MVLDIVAKVGFGIILLSSREVLDAAGDLAGSTAKPADD